ncbi:sugar ABC transporter ATP-binding protein [Azorhizobium oxalatiphilum]|uniref:Sugar ABC transporter ATP-binding protein n=1 Tax=Azorhizobium oxalatiphilum TaxID=980631 RepID=A0A917BQG6_9HYPH|nr:ABC transporter ATP-binding protein [Azorhizobium oxalatiphilum]GGF55206.1 sugar ABC transporter ATP-binding protein [Azorhizobium oxalatiphilum]
MAAIEARDLIKSFRGTSVLKGVSLNIADGEFVSLVGPSGCGKTTLLRILAGLELQDAGEVSIAGRVVDDLEPKARDVAMVFQSYALYPHLTVAENIAVPLVMRRLTTAGRLPVLGGLMPHVRRARKGIAGEVATVARTLEIEHLLDRKPGQLSGGQRQRVAVARAMVREPKAFLMDEPLSNLDAKLRTQMRAEISQLHRRLGATFVYVTHDQAEAMTMSDRIAVMMGGELLQFGTPDEIYAEPVDIRVAEFIGSPRINVLEARSDGQGAASAGPIAFSLANAKPQGEVVRVAFRPEAAELAAPDTGLAGRVEHTENFGSDLFVHVRAEGAAAPVIVRSRPQGRRAQIGDHVGIKVAPDRLMAFGGDHKRLAAVAA